MDDSLFLKGQCQPGSDEGEIKSAGPSAERNARMASFERTLAFTVRSCEVDVANVSPAKHLAE
jgi:hypothetical protein